MQFAANVRATLRLRVLRALQLHVSRVAKVHSLESRHAERVVNGVQE